MQSKSFKRAGYSQEEAHFYEENVRLIENYRSRKRRSSAAKAQGTKSPASGPPHQYQAKKKVA